MLLNILANEQNFKNGAKKLGQELERIHPDIKLSHGALLNLLARTLGVKDYNTFKAIQKTPLETDYSFTGNERKLFYLIGSKSDLDKQEIFDIIKYIKKIQLKHFNSTLIISLEESENIKFEDIDSLYVFIFDTIFLYYTTNITSYLMDERVLSEVSLSKTSIEMIKKLDFTSRCIWEEFLTSGFPEDIDEAISSTKLAFTLYSLEYEPEIKKNKNTKRIKEILQYEKSHNFFKLDEFNEENNTNLSIQELESLKNDTTTIIINDTQKTSITLKTFTIIQILDEEINLSVNEYIASLYGLHNHPWGRLPKY